MWVIWQPQIEDSDIIHRVINKEGFMGNKSDEMMGKAKKNMGKATNNREMEAKGKTQETKGKAEGKLEDFQEDYLA